MARKTITLTLHLNEVIYQVQNKTYLTSKSRSNGNNFEEVANMQANSDEENMSQIMGSIKSAVASFRMKMSEYISETKTTANNDEMSSEGDVTLTLTMPSNFNEGSVDSIMANFNDYVIYRAVAEWFTISNKTDTNDYAAMAENSIAQAREAINKRVRPQKG